MSPLRTILLLATVIGSTGCYDLSAPTGPRPDDFAKNRAAAPGDPAPTDDACTGNDCPAESALTTRATPPAADRNDDDVVFANDAAHQALAAGQK